MTDKTQEELRKILSRIKIACGGFTKALGDEEEDRPELDKAIKSLTHYINKYYVPRDDGLEVTPSRRKATNNQADKSRETIGNVGVTPEHLRNLGNL